MLNSLKELFEEESFSPVVVETFKNFNVLFNDKKEFLVYKVSEKNNSIIIQYYNKKEKNLEMFSLRRDEIFNLYNDDTGENIRISTYSQRGFHLPVKNKKNRFETIILISNLMDEEIILDKDNKSNIAKLVNKEKTQ